MSADPEFRSPSNLDAGAGASDESIQAVHAALREERTEPTEGFSYLPLVLLGLVSTMIFIVSIYFVQHRAGFESLVYDERFDPATMGANKAGPVELTPEQIIAAGKKLYASGGACITCHQQNGKGVAGAFPPLVGSEWVTGSEERLIRVVLHGLAGPIKVEGVDYNSAMPAFGPGGFNWNDQKISQVLTYIRQEWGNAAPPVTAEKVAEVRTKAPRTTAWTAAELEAIQ